MGPDPGIGPSLELTGTHLSKADLDLADLAGADLTFSKLKGTRIGGFDLTTTKGLTQQQIDSHKKACELAK
jgi:uncharacterized protein YjbI with pentapeptide repeats